MLLFSNEIILVDDEMINGENFRWKTNRLNGVRRMCDTQSEMHVTAVLVNEWWRMDEWTGVCVRAFVRTLVFQDTLNATQKIAQTRKESRRDCPSPKLMFTSHAPLL